MKKIITILSITCVSVISWSQVGINTLDPNATLDISASNISSPINTDGLLIPRVNAFPTTNPGADQDSMLIYLNTTVGISSPGFYYWNNATTTWLPLGNNDNGWSINGNSGTVNGTNFLGTTDAQSLDIRTNNVIRARFTQNGQIETLNNGQSVLIGEEAGENQDNSATRRNTFIGFRAGEEITTSVNNTAIGWQALDAATSGVNNILAIGQNALGSLTTGQYNLALGNSALSRITSGENNVAVGPNAMDNSVAGERNSALGRRAGSNSDGNDNVFFGYQADAFNGLSGAAENVVIGSRAGHNGGSLGDNLSGRVLIGFQSGSQESNDNRLYIENSNSVTPLVYGEFDNDVLRVGGQLQIGSSDDTTAGAIYSFPVVDGTSGQALVTDGAGVVSWQTVSGGGADTQDLSIDNTTAELSLVDGGTVELKTIADTDANTKIQAEEAANEDVIRFDIGGTEHFTMSASGHLQVLNTAQSVLIGEEAGIAQDFSATRRNTFIGYQAAHDNTTGVNNTAVGWGAFDKNLTGSNNVAIGTGSLDRDTDATRTVAIGSSALGNTTGATERSVVIGFNALSNSTASIDNTVIGDAAGANIDGENNVIIGTDTDAFNDGITASRNTIIGAYAGESAISGTAGGATFQGRVLLGYGAGGDNGIDNTLFIENSSTRTPLIGGDFASDRVGINVNIDSDGTGTANLTHTLTVGGDVYAAGGFETPTNNYPDYVFENYFKNTSEINKTYQFTPLNEAIEFVKSNGHLPNVKSLKEVQEDGMKINLGATSVKNLEKIEENFIYISELYEQNKNDKKKISVLEDKIEEVTEENSLLKAKLNAILKRLDSLESK